MDRMLVVVFDSEDKAYEGKRALSQLDSDGSIGLWAYTPKARIHCAPISSKTSD